MLASPETFLNPKEIVRSFGLQAGDHAADFGAGHGYFTTPMAKAVGGDGKVYAIDIQKPTLETIKARAKLEHLLNIEYIWSDIDAPGGSQIKAGYLDFILISNVLFQSENRPNVMKEAGRILREGGQAAIIEWDPGDTRLGPPAEQRIAKESAQALTEQAGLTFVREFPAGAYHYGLLFQKK